MFSILLQAGSGYDPTKNEWYFYTAYTLVWVLLLLYLVRLHLMIREVRRQQDQEG